MSIIKMALIYSILILFSLSSMSYGTIYYVDNCDVTGNDSNNGTATNTPWLTISKVNSSTFSGDDQILFRKGCTWREQLNFPSSGTNGHPITFGAYGTGNKPKIYGSLVPSSWTEEIVSGAVTITKVQGPLVTTEADASVTKTFSNTPTEGNLIVVYGKSEDRNISDASVSSSSGSFTLATSVQTGSASYMGIWYRVAGASEATAITLDWTSSTSTTIIIEEWNGLNTSSVLDKTASTATTGSGVTSRSTGTTATTTANNELLVAAVGMGSTTSSRSWSNSFTTNFDNNAYVMHTAYKSVTATGAYESTCSWTTSRVAGATIATFKAPDSVPDKTLYYTTQTADPLYLFIIDTNGVIHKGNKVADKATLASEYDWWFDDPNNRLYVYAATDPSTRYNSVEVPDIVSRTRGIWWGGVSAKEYIVVDGFEIAFTPGVGIVVRGGTQVLNNYVHHIGDEATTGHSYGIEVQTGGDCTVSGNTVHNTYSGGIYLVASYSPYGNSNTVVENNTVYDAKGGLIKVVCRDGYTMDDNIFRRNNLYHTAGFSASNDYGIFIEPEDGCTSNSGQIYFNVIDVKLRAISLENYTTDMELYNNTLKSASGSGIYIGATGTSGMTIKNNIVVDAGLYALQIAEIDAITACDYNLWYAPSGTAYARIESTNYTSTGFADYKSATGWDTNGLWQDPLVISSSNLRLQSTSPSSNTGTNVSLTADYTGVVIPQGFGFDMGAYEFTSILELSADNKITTLTTDNKISGLK